MFVPQYNTNMESSDVNLFLENSCRRFSESEKVALLERLRYSDSLLGPTIIYVPNASSLYSTPAHTHVKCAARNKHWRVVSCQTPVAVVCPEGCRRLGPWDLFQSQINTNTQKGADCGSGICHILISGFWIFRLSLRNQTARSKIDSVPCLAVLGWVGGWALGWPPEFEKEGEE